MASSQSTQLQPFFSASARDQSAVLVTVAIVAAAVAVLSIAAKLFWRRNIFSLKIYDYALLGGAALLFVYTSLIVYSANLGVGKHREDIGDGNLTSIRKVQYVITLLGIVIGACTKMSMCLFIKSINTYTNVFRANWVLMGVVGVLFLGTFLANCFTCSLPSPWLADSAAACPAASSIYFFTLVSSMTTDTLIWVLAIVMICKVQTIIKTKVFVISLFSFRMICVATTVPALLDTTHLYNSPDIDYTWLSLAPAVWLAATANCSVITACVPSLKGLFDSWLGNTIGLDIDAPYQLERMTGKNTFEATAYEGGAGSGGAATKNSNNSNNSSNSKNSSASRKGSIHPDGSEGHRGAALLPGGESARFAALRLGASQTNEAACYAERRTSTPGGARAGSAATAKRSHHDADGLSSDDYDDEYDVHESESVKRLTRGIVIRDEVEVRFDGGHHNDSGHQGHRRDRSSGDDLRPWSAST